jgi:hypothetical protein
MARIIDDRTSLDLTVKIFDDFYAFNMVVNGNEYDIVNGYFKSVCDTKAIAGNFTAFLFRIAQEIFRGDETPINLEEYDFAYGRKNKLQLA